MPLSLADIATRKLLASATIIVVSIGACDVAEVPAGPPRCEPESELWLERLLKEGYRALSEGRTDDATARFQRVIELDASHPEALRGLAQAEMPARDDEPHDAAATTQPHTVTMAGRAIPVDVPIVHGIYDFETLKRLAPLRAAHAEHDGAPPAHTWYGERAGASRRDNATAEAWTTSLLSHIDLIVLHDTHTRTADEAFVNFEYGGASTHFLIAADGTIFQTLDLAYEANHTRQVALDGRSVAIDLVNPVDIDGPPGPEGAPPRPLSEFESLQGKAPVQEHGYTDAQLASVTALSRALCALLPATPCALPPADDRGRLPRAAIPAADTFRGIAGHLHVTPIALDPGAGFPWETFATSIGKVP